MGRGYNFSSYLDDEQNQNILWMTNSAMNYFWINRATNYNDNQAKYYVDLNQSQINLFKNDLSLNYGFFTSYLIKDNFNDLQNNFRLKLTTLETLLFTIFGLLVFIVSIIIVIIIFKKELMRQSSSLGVLIALGTKLKKLIFSLAFSYLTLLIIPLILGFAISFAFQFCLTQLISKIIFFPFPLVSFFTIPTIISLIVFPMILIISLSLLFYFLLKKTPLELIYKRKKIKYQKLKLEKSSLFKKSINYHLTLAFAKSNKSQVFSTLIIFIVNFFMILFLLSFINIYHYSSSFFEKQYTDYGNRVFNDSNPTINDLFTTMINNSDFNDINNNSFYWVSKQNFIAGQGSKYTEVTLDNISTINNWYNKYLTPITVKNIADNPEKIKNAVSLNFYKLLLQIIPIWKNNHIYPYVTSGFKIYNANHSLPITSKLSAKWDINGTNGFNDFYFEGYQNNQFLKWIYCQGANSSQALNLINQENSSYLNAILPLTMAKQLHLQINDIITSQISIDSSNDQIWSKIPIHVVGINNYNYLDNIIIVNQQLLFKYIINQYQTNNPRTTINISNYDIFLNSMLVRDQIPEISRNVSFYNYNKDYSDFNNLQLDANIYYYFTTKYSDITINICQYIANLLKGLEVLIVVAIVIAVIVILIMIYLVFIENKNNIISLKCLGYNNFKIVNFLLLFYIVGFIFFTLIVTGIIYLILTPILDLLLKTTGILLLFNFSWILWLILIISIIFLMLISFSIGWVQIMKSKITDLELLY